MGEYIQWRYKILYLLGPDAIALFFVWLLYMVALWPLALMQQWKLGVIASPMSIGLALTFVAFSVGRGIAWLVMAGLSLVAAIAGTAQGLYLRQVCPILDEHLPLKYPACALHSVFIPAGLLLVVLAVVAPVIRKCGGRIVGSTAEYNKKIAAYMIFGTSIHRNLEHVQQGGRHLAGLQSHHVSVQELRDAKIMLKLHTEFYFSGEPIYDFAFWLSNHHMVLSILFHHPLHPLATGHRLMICCVTAILIVAPVSLVTVLWPLYIPPNMPGQGICRLIFMALVFIVPRNKIKKRMQEVAVEDEEEAICIARNDGSTSGFGKAKRKLLRKEACFYGLVGIMTSFFCWLTWKVVKSRHLSEGGREPLDLFLMNTDGLGFCFVLEILMVLLLPIKSKDQSRRCFGWFGRWRDERIRHLSSVGTDSLNTELSFS